MKKQSHTKSEGKAPHEVTQSSSRQWPWRRISELCCLTFALIAMAWLAGDLLGTHFTLHHATISGRPANQTIRERVAQLTSSYQLSLRYPDGTTKTYGWQAMGIQVDTATTVASMRRAQHSWTHIMHWWQPIPVALSLQVNQTQLAAFVSQHASIVTQPAQNATLTIADGTAKAIDGAPGKQYGLARGTQTILQAVHQLQTSPLPLAPVALPPDQNEASLATAKAQLTAILNQHITITVGSQTVTPSAQDIANWVTIAPAPSGVSLSIDSGKVHDYLNGIASDHSQPPRSQIVLSSGDIVQAGVKGVTVSTSQSVIDSLVAAAGTGKDSQLTLPVQYTAFQTVNAPTAGKWIEVNLSTKRMYAYNQGSLVRTFLVSAGAAGTPTVTGSFAIYSKYASQDMYGQNLNGTRYYQPAVPYVNYFYRDYAIHGNYWRPSYYFGSINSSHGCVGVPVSDGAWIYSWAPIGTPVVVHY